jgi:hypothetical protein
MFDAFRILRDVHELLVLLEAAGRLPLDDTREARRNELDRALRPSAWTPRTLAQFERGTLARETKAFLRSLTDVAPRRRLRVLE